MRYLPRTLLIGIGVAGLIPGQAPGPKAPAKPPAATPVQAKPAAVSAEVATIIELVKTGVAEPLIVESIRQEGKSYRLRPADLLALKKAGASEKVIAALINPAAAGPQPAAAPRAPAAAVPAPVASGWQEAGSEAGASAAVVSTSERSGWRQLESVAPARAPAAAAPSSAPLSASARPAARVKRRVAVDPFDYSAVRTWVTFWFNGDVNIGQGIRSMMVVRMAKSNKITLLEREKLQELMREQDLGASHRVAQGSKARIGRLKGADAILYGDIVIFGRDDVKKGGMLGGVTNTLGPIWGRVANAVKEEKAVVGINYRLVDAETGEVLDSGEARGESDRRSANWDAIIGRGGNAASGGYDMTSSNFEETIIGEATSNAVDILIEQLDGKVERIDPKQMAIEGRVASISGSIVYLNVGANDGVQPGDRFEVNKIIRPINDPETNELLGTETVKAGELLVSEVRERMSSGQYSGQALDRTYKHGYAVRKVN
jgi:curli biogenesis system outer membrane secretion channel CsgG